MTVIYNVFPKLYFTYTCSFIPHKEKQKKNIIYRKRSAEQMLPHCRKQPIPVRNTTAFNQWSSCARNAKQSTDDNPAYES
jgi:hypothetical protein